MRVILLLDVAYLVEPLLLLLLGCLGRLTLLSDLLTDPGTQKPQGSPMSVLCVLHDEGSPLLQLGYTRLAAHLVLLSDWKGGLDVLLMSSYLTLVRP